MKWCRAHLECFQICRSASDSLRIADPVFEEGLHGGLEIRQTFHILGSTWGYCLHMDMTVCCTIGRVPVGCLRNRACVAGSPFHVQLLSTSRNCRRDGCFPQLAASIDSICIVCSIKAVNRDCFEDSEDLTHAAFEFGARLTRFRMVSVFKTRSLHYLCISASISESSLREFQQPVHLTITVENGSCVFCDVSGLLIGFDIGQKGLIEAAVGKG
jgi:hypothetical protein